MSEDRRKPEGAAVGAEAEQQEKNKVIKYNTTRIWIIFLKD